MSREIVIQVKRCILVLTEGELLTMLQSHPDIWEKSLKRGKGVQRYRQEARRNGLREQGNLNNLNPDNPDNNSGNPDNLVNLGKKHFDLGNLVN